MTAGKGESLIEHIEALRQTLISCFLALGIMFIPCFAAAPFLTDKLINLLLKGQDVALNYFAPMEVFLLQIKLAFVVDLICCSPFIAWRLWLFLAPALYERERRFVCRIIGFSAGLFSGGVLFCLFFILPAVISFGMSFSGAHIQALLGVSNVVDLALHLSVVFGLMFQFPLITFALIKCDFISYESVCRKRPYVFMGILILSAFLTPPDIASQLCLTIPTYLLFEGGLLAGRGIKKNKIKKEKGLT